MIIYEELKETASAELRRRESESKRAGRRWLKGEAEREKRKMLEMGFDQT